MEGWVGEAAVGRPWGVGTTDTGHGTWDMGTWRGGPLKLNPSVLPIATLTRRLDGGRSSGSNVRHLIAFSL